MWRTLSHTTPHFQKRSAPLLFQASQNHPRFRSLSQLSHNLHEQSDCADHKIPPTSCGAWKSKNEGCKGSAITVTKTALFSSALNLCSFSACASRAVSVQGHRVRTTTESKNHRDNIQATTLPSLSLTFKTPAAASMLFAATLFPLVESLKPSFDYLHKAALTLTASYIPFRTILPSPIMKTIGS